MSKRLLFCVTTDVYFNLQEGYQNGLALLTQSHLIDAYCNNTKIDCFILFDINRYGYDWVYLTIVALGLIRTRHFDAQYCDKMILTLKDIFEPLTSIGQGKLLTNHKSRYFMFRYELSLVSHWNPWLKKYIFIAISFCRNIACRNVSCE